MKLYKSSKVTLLHPQFLSPTFGILNAAIVLLISLVAGASGTSMALIKLYAVIYPGYGLNFMGILLGIIWGFIYGLVLGYLIALIYGTLVARKVKNVQDMVLELNPDQKINVLQEGEGNRPYTLVFVANPVIALPASSSFEDDPIMTQPAVFYHTVIRCLRSFANNELLRLPEIARKLRIILLFDDTRRGHADENALCEEISPEATILAPRQDVAIIDHFIKNTHDDDRSIDYADVVFVISASERLTRSSARFTTETDEDVAFKFTFSENLTDLTEKKQAFFPALPGVVALSAWDDRLKTPVHEFAHAMSSLENGAIVDEYLDTYAPGTESSLQHVINRKRRPSSSDAIPDLFAKYQGPQSELVEYFSDRYRSDKPDEWTSYVPERTSLSYSCIMDVAYFGYRYDKLIFDFMYDRLLLKINRP